MGEKIRKLNRGEMVDAEGKRLVRKRMKEDPLCVTLPLDELLDSAKRLRKIYPDK